MKRNEVQTLIITNLPSFYKINLYNAIARHKRIFVIFTGDTAEQRNTDFFEGDAHFDCLSLSGNRALKFIRVCKELFRHRYEELMLGGWDSLPLWLGAFLSPKRKNTLVVESSYLESSTSGWKRLVKKLFISRISKVYASGASQRKITDRLGFRGKTMITKGVGIFNYGKQPAYEPKNEVRKFIYVGRLVQVKNLELLVRVFNDLPKLELTIVGFGDQEEWLRSIAHENVVFTGAIENKRLPELYRSHDVFVLPSRSEPWGLVVEEAFNNGLPVIVSNRVGCAEEIVNKDNGRIFKWNDPDDLKSAILKLQDIASYNSMRKHISEMNFEEITNYQINCYL